MYAYLGDGVHLVEEEDAGGGRAGLLEELTHVGLGLSEPHGQQLGACSGTKQRKDKRPTMIYISIHERTYTGELRER